MTEVTKYTHKSPPVHAPTGLGSVPRHHLVTTPLKFLSGRNMLFNAGWIRGECVCVLVWGCGGAVAGSGAQRGGGSTLF